MTDGQSDGQPDRVYDCRTLCYINLILRAVRVPVSGSYLARCPPVISAGVLSTFTKRLLKVYNTSEPCKVKQIPKIRDNYGSGWVGGWVGGRTQTKVNKSQTQ